VRRFFVLKYLDFEVYVEELLSFLKKETEKRDNSLVCILNSSHECEIREYCRIMGVSFVGESFIFFNDNVPNDRIIKIPYKYVKRFTHEKEGSRKYGGLREFRT